MRNIPDVGNSQIINSATIPHWIYTFLQVAAAAQKTATASKEIISIETAIMTNKKSENYNNNAQQTDELQECVCRNA